MKKYNGIYIKITEIDKKDIVTMSGAEAGFNDTEFDAAQFSTVEKR